MPDPEVCLGLLKSLCVLAPLREHSEQRRMLLPHLAFGRYSVQLV